MRTGRIPTEFRYFENIQKPANQRRRKFFKLALGFDPVLPDDVVRTWAQTYYDADPVAEAFVDEVYLKQGQAAGRRLIDRALEHGVDSVADAPASLKVLFAELDGNFPNHPAQVIIFTRVMKKKLQNFSARFRWYYVL